MAKKEKTLATKDDDLGLITYSRTKQTLDEWAVIRDKYFPESDRWGLNSLQEDDNLFENEERKEEKKKFEFYKKRATSTFWDLIPLTQFRLSLMALFTLADDLTFSGNKVKKLRNQLRLER